MTHKQQQIFNEAIAKVQELIGFCNTLGHVITELEDRVKALEGPRHDPGPTPQNAH